MTCKWGEKKNMMVLLAVGLFFLIDGLICNLFLPEEAHLPSRIAGFFSGMGGSFTAISLVVLVRRRIIGEVRANDSELFPSEEDAADRWFKCKLFFITLDEKSGAEKKTSTTVLVQASDLRDAVKKLDEGMKGTMADYVIASVAETAIMDVYPYEAEPDVKPEFPDAGKTE